MPMNDHAFCFSLSVSISKFTTPVVEKKKFYNYWIPIKNFDLLFIDKIKLYMTYQIFFRNKSCDRKVAEPL